MENKNHGEEIELLRVECELLDMALDSEGELRDEVITRARSIGGAAVRLLEQSDEEGALALVREAQDILEQAARLRAMTPPSSTEINFFIFPLLWHF